jgi:hypothetical protein
MCSFVEFCCEIVELQPPWSGLRAWIDAQMVSSVEHERKEKQLETVCRILEEDCDYPIEHVAQGGALASETPVHDRIDVILVAVMKEYQQDMVRRIVCCSFVVTFRCLC